LNKIERFSKVSRHFFYLSAFLLFFYLSGFLSGRPIFAHERCYVKWVSDGDTIVLADGRHIRYIGINAPEIDHENKKAEFFGYNAKKYNETLVLSKMVRLEFDKETHDRYGRTLAYVFLKNGVFVNKVMIERGYAYCLPRRPNIKYGQVLLQSQRNAMLAKRGIWRNWKEKKERYWGNRRSKRFHYTTCAFGKKITGKNKIIFLRKWDAFWGGYAPCKKCMAGEK
jgi:micrococcal nuclease